MFIKAFPHYKEKKKKDILRRFSYKRDIATSAFGQWQFQKQNSYTNFKSYKDGIIMRTD